MSSDVGGETGCLFLQVCLFVSNVIWDMGYICIMDVYYGRAGRAGPYGWSANEWVELGRVNDFLILNQLLIQNHNTYHIAHHHLLSSVLSFYQPIFFGFVILLLLCSSRDIQ